MNVNMSTFRRDLGTHSNKAAKSTFWSALENGGLVFISFGSLVVFSRLLSASDFGAFSIVLALVELFGVVVNMLFHDALIQRRDISEDHFDSAFVFTLGLSILLMLLCCSAAPFFARFLNQPQIVKPLMVMALCVPCAGLSATIVARQRRDLELKPLAVRSLASRLGGALLGLVAAFIGAGVWSLVIQQVMMALVASLVLWITCGKRPRFRFQVKAVKELLSFGLYAVGGLLILFSIQRLFIIFAGRGLGSRESGYLNLSFRTIDMVLTIAATAMAQVSLPMLSALQQNKDKLKQAYQTAVEFSCAVFYPIFIGLALMAPEIIRIAYGAKWMPSQPYIVIIACLTLLRAPRLFIAPMLTALGRPRDTWIGYGAHLVTVAIPLALFPSANLAWIMGIWILGEVVESPVAGFMLWSSTGYKATDQLGGIQSPLISVTIMAAAVLGARSLFPSSAAPWVNLSLLAPLGASVYCICLYATDKALFSRILRFGAAALKRESLTADLREEAVS